ncbi:MFS transporter [Paraburkholderia phenoliruptrix]|uniref:MFS transporter n=1 Tax=Paraburkholderia phenoliruptrix TaxID=252970 RepID=UPI001C500D27|nr:MFS transporter [Paraburkholderia phenoliruptrix]MBW0447066.1 MFS transporter [Paraburkholderia phenoliruptrix]MBW9101078.1 MFS transporter [Paraburkholderia phenoliruptrix]
MNPPLSPASSAGLENATYAKVTWRLLPFLFICYVAAYLDRVNVGFAKLQMLSDLKFSESVYGLGAGIFFIGYFVFEVPSNVLLHRVGARVWISRIMMTWAVVSAASLFVKTPAMFYLVRFLLGVAEAGFFPGIVLYLTYWYPSSRRGRMNALFMIGIPVAGVVGGPLSGWIMQAFNGVHGMSNWQWLYLIEAAPSLVLGILVLFLLPNGIRAASWLDESQKQLLEANLARDGNVNADHSLKAVVSNARVWHLAAIYFCCMMGLYGVSFYLPTLVKAAGVKDAFAVGLLTAVPYAVAIVSMVLVAKSSDERRERRWHLATAAIAASIGFYASTLYTDNLVLVLITLSAATAGVLSMMPVFWTYPSSVLSGTAAAAGIAMINSIGNLAGFVSPSIIGWMKDVTHSTNAGLVFVAFALFMGAVLTLMQRGVARSAPPTPTPTQQSRV